MTQGPPTPPEPGDPGPDGLSIDPGEETAEEHLPPVGTWTGELIQTLSGSLRIARNFTLVIVAALVAAIPLFYLSKSNPATGYHALYQGSLGSRYAVGETLVEAMPLFVSGLAVTLAFQAGLFNIGVEGQLLMGGLVAGTLGTKLSLPPGIHLLVAILGGMAAGALWALVPGLLKARRGVHEVITTIMLNYVAFSVSRYLVHPSGLLVSKTQPSATDLIRPTAELPNVLGGTRVHAGIWVAILAGIFCWYLLFRTPLGYRFRVVGRNPLAARFNGIQPSRVIIQAMMISGALGGLAGALEVLGLLHRYYDAFSPGYGFDAIAVALLGALNPIGVAVAALFFGVLRAGSTLMQALAGVSRDMISVFSGLVVGFAAAVPLVDRLFKKRRGARYVTTIPSPAELASEQVETTVP